MKTAAIIDALKLEPHPEGGYFRRIYTSDKSAPIGPEQAERKTLTCIHYLLTLDAPLGALHVNQSDIVHFYQLGDPVEYTLVSPDGTIERVTLGPDIDSGHQLHLTVPGNWWKASQLKTGAWSLVSEAVSPGFEYADMRFIEHPEVKERFPGLLSALIPLLGRTR